MLHQYFLKIKITLKYIINIECKITCHYIAVIYNKLAHSLYFRQQTASLYYALLLFLINFESIAYLNSVLFSLQMMLHGFVLHVLSALLLKFIMTKLFSIYNIYFINYNSILDQNDGV